MDSLGLAHHRCGYADYLAQYMKFPPAGVQPSLDGMYNQSSDSCDVWNLAYEAAYQPNPCFNVYEVRPFFPNKHDLLTKMHRSVARAPS
jgi:carboxypeptidase D